MAFPVINIWMSLTASQKMKGFLNKLGIWGLGEWHREHTPCREATVQNIGINGSHPVLNLRKINRKVKNLPEMWETQVQSLGREDPLEKEMTICSSILAWRTPWTEEPGGLQSVGSQSGTRLSTCAHLASRCFGLVTWPSSYRCLHISFLLVYLPLYPNVPFSYNISHTTLGFTLLISL